MLTLLVSTLTSVFSKAFFIGSWDPDVGGRRIESSLQKGEQIPEYHLRAWRIAREEILMNILQWVRLVIENYFAWTGQMIYKDKLMQMKFPEVLWEKISTFLENLSLLPCWIDKELSSTVFGAKQNRDFWGHVFKTGKSPTGVPVLTKPLDLITMSQ